jgi:hypothetical protein
VKSARTESLAAGILVDYAASGEPIGIEITSPQHVNADQLNAILTKFGYGDVDPSDLAPLRAA